MNNKIVNNCVFSNISVAEAMQKINTTSKGILFVTDSKQRLTGCVSDGDIRRWLLKTTDFSSPIDNCMCKTPKWLTQVEAANAKQFMRENKITAVPVLDDKKRIVDIVYLNDLQGNSEISNVTLKNTPVVIMAGGKGTRLRPYTKILPKPLIPVGDIPILERIINRFADAGAKDFYISVNYKKKMIKSYFDEIEHSYSIKYIDEDIPLGTGGSIKLIDDRFESPFIVTNCDTLINVNYDELMDYHKKSNNDITVIAANKNTVIPYGVFKTGNGGEILSIEEKPVISNLINTGMYIVEPKMIDLIPDGVMFHMTHLLEKALEKGKEVGIFPIDEESFLDMGEFAEMKRMEEKLKKAEG